MKGIYFQEKGIELLKQCGLTKSEFARRMGVLRQNVNVLFKTNNLEIIARAAEVLDVPLALLVGYVNEPDIEESPTPIDIEEKWEFYRRISQPVTLLKTGGLAKKLSNVFTSIGRREILIYADIT